VGLRRNFNPVAVAFEMSVPCQSALTKMMVGRREGLCGGCLKRAAHVCACVYWCFDLGSNFVGRETYENSLSKSEQMQCERCVSSFMFKTRLRPTSHDRVVIIQINAHCTQLMFLTHHMFDDHHVTICKKCPTPGLKFFARPIQINSWVPKHKTQTIRFLSKYRLFVGSSSC
jgi:hypothetical protein